MKLSFFSYLSEINVAEHQNSQWKKKIVAFFKANNSSRKKFALA